MSATNTDGTYWADALGLTDDIETHDEPARKFADVFAQDDGTVVFDEGWGTAWIESDTVVEVRR